LQLDYPVAITKRDRCLFHRIIFRTAKAEASHAFDCFGDEFPPRGVHSGSICSATSPFPCYARRNLSYYTANSKLPVSFRLSSVWSHLRKFSIGVPSAAKGELWKPFLMLFLAADAGSRTTGGTEDDASADFTGRWLQREDWNRCCQKLIFQMWSGSDYAQRPTMNCGRLNFVF
jgi:hypothetical protein